MRAESSPLAVQQRDFGRDCLGFERTGFASRAGLPAPDKVAPLPRKRLIDRDHSKRGGLVPKPLIRPLTLDHSRPQEGQDRATRSQEFVQLEKREAVLAPVSPNVLCEALTQGPGRNPHVDQYRWRPVDSCAEERSLLADPRRVDPRTSRNVSQGARGNAGTALTGSLLVILPGSQRSPRPATNGGRRSSSGRALSHPASKQ